ncbi:MAG TPA: hypothetical protein VG713_09510 [Pirellulales bacterium]|nr:hypothetical protein [Pirellulales bacterium]
MAIAATEARLDHTLAALLGRLRWRIRAYIVAQGISLTVITAILAFALLVVIDWVFEPTRDVRLVLLVLAVAATAYSAWRWLLDRLRVALPDRSMAVLLERWFPFQESLLTAVEMAGRMDPSDELAHEMFLQSEFEANRQAATVDLARVFNRRPLLIAMGTAIALVVTVVAVAAAKPDMARFALARVLTATDELWPRSTRLVAEGFDHGEAVVAKGAEFKLVVRADATMAIPEKVQLRYVADDGTSDRKYMVRVGVADPSRDQYQNFEYLFQSLLSPLKLVVRGGDDRISGLRVRVVDSPTVTLTLHCDYPSYMQLASRDIPATAVTPIPQAAKVIVRATSNKPLLAAEVHVRLASGSPVIHNTTLTSSDSFEFVVPRLDQETTLEFKLLDADHVRNRDAIQITLVPVPDAPPQVNVQLTGIGSAITANARLPFVGNVTDDYAVTTTWIATTVDGNPPAKQLLQPKVGTVEVPIEAAFEVRDLGLMPEQKLLVGVEAADNRQLASANDNDASAVGPNVASSERWLLDVVTPEQLRAQLESRELNLRQRFDAMIAEMIETRDSLTGANSTKPENSAEAAEQLRLRIARAQQNSEKNAHDTAGLAIAFDGIREELVNNRVDTEELRLRLKQQIADPLRQIVANNFPAFDIRLKAVEAGVATGNASTSLTGAIAAADELIVAMQRVRDKMLELETFNEAIDLLREIIAAQRQINEQTKKQRSEKVRKLLEE